MKASGSIYLSGNLRNMLGTRVPQSTGDDGHPYELGMMFTSSVPAHLHAIRFYKPAGEAGTHVGNLWSDAGGQIGVVTFQNGTANGWKQANFSSPILMQANTPYNGEREHGNEQPLCCPLERIHNDHSY
jgi:hypothetical protein